MQTQTTATAVNTKAKRKYSGMPRSRRIMQNLTFWIPVVIFALLITCALFAHFIAPYPYDKMDMANRWAPPGTPGHLLGTDTLGRDILSRVIYGAQTSLAVSLLVVAITAGFGTALGILSGYLGGNVDSLIMRITDIALSFPGMLMAILLAVSLGPGFMTVVFALSILGWAGYTRLVRGEALRIRNSDFVAQARVAGASSWRIMLVHIFPNIVNPLIVIMTMAVGMMILAESGMSYLGIGIPPPRPSWGNMVSDGRSYLSPPQSAWWISLFPGICIGLVVMSGNFLGDWIRDKMDPRLRQL